METELGAKEKNPAGTFYGYQYYDKTENEIIEIKIVGKLKSDAKYYMRVQATNLSNDAGSPKDIIWT